MKRSTKLCQSGSEGQTNLIDIIPDIQSFRNLLEIQSFRNPLEVQSFRNLVLNWNSPSCRGKYGMGHCNRVEMKEREETRIVLTWLDSGKMNQSKVQAPECLEKVFLKLAAWERIASGTCVNYFLHSRKTKGPIVLLNIVSAACRDSRNHSWECSTRIQMELPPVEAGGRITGILWKSLGCPKLLASDPCREVAIFGGYYLGIPLVATSL